MTISEARSILHCPDAYGGIHGKKYGQALNMAMEALNREPCNDAISRQAVEEMIKAEMPERGIWEIEGDKEKEVVCEVCVDLMQKLSELPPATPQPKTGRWIVDVDKWGDVVTTINGYRCDRCNAFNADKDNYCPYCGAKMQEAKQ